MPVSAPYTLMGVVNVTPDSFSDGGDHLDPAAAIARGHGLLREGADWLDVGGESTRPGAAPVPAGEEIARVLPVVEALAAAGARVSIDTSKPAVAAAAIAAGARLINDVTALRDPAMAALAADTGVTVCLMHMQGAPRTMQRDPRYGDVVGEVRAFLEARLGAAVRAGIAAERVLLDPGIGFGKTAAHNLALLARLDELAAIGPPLVLGASRKSFLGGLTGHSDPAARVAATAATSVLGLERGATWFRVHDVGANADALAVAAAVLASRP